MRSKFLLPTSRGSLGCCRCAYRKVKSFVPEHIHNLALSAADAQADSARFVELMLGIIRGSLKELAVIGRGTDQDTDPVSDQDRPPWSVFSLSWGIRRYPPRSS